jgi:hypothetical protein
LKGIPAYRTCSTNEIEKDPTHAKFEDCRTAIDFARAYRDEDDDNDANVTAFDLES